MTERPILFSDEMVRAILEGRKTVTRRIMKRFVADPGRARLLHTDPVHGTATFADSIPDDPHPLVIECPYGAEGDSLWVRETWGVGRRHQEKRPSVLGGNTLVRYRSTPDPHWTLGGRWRPSIHMPRAFCRLRLEVLDVRPERLSQISADEVLAEGIHLPVSPLGNLLIEIGRGCASHYLPEDYFSDPRRDSSPEFVRHHVARAYFAALWDGLNGKRGPEGHPDAFSWLRDPWVWRVEFCML